jgi:choline dehydrogenase
MKSALACVELCREIGNSAPLRPFVKRKVMPDNLKRDALEDFVRSGAMINLASDVFAKVGRDAVSVVDNHLKVYAIDNLLIADFVQASHRSICLTTRTCLAGFTIVFPESS